jgi:hypothetical protein
LDNVSAPLPGLLHQAAGDLEYAYYATERVNHQAGRRIMASVFAEMESPVTRSHNDLDLAVWLKITNGLRNW